MQVIMAGDHDTELPLPARVRVVIPCRNEAGYIGALLESLATADRSGMDLQVWVCDGMSDDGTRDIVAQHAVRHPFIRLVDNPARTTPQAMNLGLQDLDYDVGIILGAHAEVDPAFLQENIAVLRAHPDVGCAGGIIENVYEGTAARRIGMAMGHPFGVGNAHFRTGRAEGYVDTVAFGAYRRAVFERVGLFDEALVRNQDDEFNYRVVKGGFRIFLSRAIRSRYYVRASLRKLFRQYYQYGYWKVYVNRKHRTVTTLRQVVPALFVAFVLLGAVAALLHPWAFLAYQAGLLLYLGVAVASALRAAGGIADVPGVLAAFLVLHSGYGIGYLYGLFHLLLLGRHPRERDKALTR
jgi:glycosyltransferase involved in cell wall biosynthesis